MQLKAGYGLFCLQRYDIDMSGFQFFTSILYIVSLHIQLCSTTINDTARPCISWSKIIARYHT